MHTFNDFINIRSYPSSSLPEIKLEPTETEVTDAIAELDNLCRSITFLKGSNVFFSERINTLANSILENLDKIKQQCKTPQEIYQFARNHLEIMHNEKKAFDFGKNSFTEKSISFNQECNNLQERLNLAPLSFKPLFPVHNRQLETNTFIDPISNFLLTPPPETIIRWGSELTEAACNSHPMAKKVCDEIASLLPESLTPTRPNALILTTSHDHNGAFSLTAKDPTYLCNVLAFKEIEKNYNAKYKYISDINSFCEAIDEEKAKGINIDVLILRVHGGPEKITLDASNYITIDDDLPKNSCLQNLAPKAVIILDSCSTGEERERKYNLANHIASHSPQESTVFAPTKTSFGFVITSIDPFDVRFFESSWPFKEKNESIKYKIDESNRDDINADKNNFNNQSKMFNDPLSFF